MSALTRRRLDIGNLILALIGITCGVFAYLMIAYADVNALVLIPGVVAATTGISHLFKREAIRSQPFYIQRETTTRAHVAHATIRGGNYPDWWQG